MNDFKKSVGKRISEIRISKGISQEILAEKVGVEPTTVSYWERGKNSITFSKLPLIAEALGVPVYKLFVFADFESNHTDFKNLLEAMTDEEISIAKAVINLIFISR